MSKKGLLACLLIFAALLLNACGVGEAPAPDSAQDAAVEEAIEEVEEAAEAPAEEALEEVEGVTEEEAEGLEEEVMEEVEELEPELDDAEPGIEAIGSEEDDGSPFDPDSGPKGAEAVTPTSTPAQAVAERVEEAELPTPLPTAVPTPFPPAAQSPPSSAPIWLWPLAIGTILLLAAFGGRTYLKK